MGRARRGVEAGRSDDRSLEQRVTAIENALQEIKSLLKREGQA